MFPGRDPFNQNSNRSDREKRTTSKGGPVFSKLFRLDRTDPLSFGPKFPESLVEWIAPPVSRSGGTDRYGRRKPTETSVFEFSYLCVNSSLEELIKIKAIFILRQGMFR